MRSLNIKQIFRVFLAVAITVVIIRTFFVDSFIVKGDSMAPTILSGDYVFVDKFSHHFRTFKREDIIVVKPRSVSSRIIKRIIGLPEERIEIMEDRILVKGDRQDQGKTLSEGYLNLPASLAGGLVLPVGLATSTIGLDKIQLDLKEYFVLGDNRYASIDSRELGPVDEWNIEGRVFLVFKSKYFYLSFFFL